MKSKIKTERRNFLLVELVTGKMDGFYGQESSALKIRDMLNKRYPNLTWIMTEILSPMTSKWYLSNAHFHATEINEAILRRADFVRGYEDADI